MDKPTEGYFGPMPKSELIPMVYEYVNKYNLGTLTISRAPSIFRQLVEAL